MQRISGVLVSLEGRREFRAGGGYTARFVLNRQDPRWPEIKEVKLFDRTERTAGFDFPSGKSKGDGRSSRCPGASSWTNGRARRI